MLQKKVCMLGSFSVGKSSLVRRFVASMFDEQYHTTIGVKVDKKVVNANGEDFTLVLWDIYGEDAFQKMRMSYLRGMHGYLLVVDGTRRQTLEDGLALHDRVVAEFEKVPAVLVLNKFDLTDQWEIEQAQETQLTAAGWTIEHTSAKTGDAEFRLIGGWPPWCANIWDSQPSGDQRIGLADKSPFLENFLVDAEEFWRASSPGAVNSGNWIERGADGREIPLEASARSLDGKRILLIHNLSETFGQQQQWFQTARNSLLEHEKLLKEIQKKEILLHCIV